MAVFKYRTKKGIRYRAEAYLDGRRIAGKGGFPSKLAAHQWEESCQTPTSPLKPQDLVLFEVATLYLLDAEQRRKKNTLIYKRTVLKRFIEFIGKDTLFASIDRADVKPFLYETATKISHKSANKYRVELSALWSWAQIEGHAQGNPARQIAPFPTKKFVKYIPPKEHIARVLQIATPFERNFLLALLHTAGRISELRELAWEDVDLERKRLRLWTSKRHAGDREPRLIAISQTLYDVLDSINKERAGGEIYVFTNPRTGTCYDRQSRDIKYLFQRVCSAAEVPLFTAHSLRHYLATNFKDPRRAQKILGHMNIRTTEIYLHDLGVDIESASIFEAITHEITHETDSGKKEGATVLQ